MSDLVERVAKASYEAGVLYWKQRNSFLGSALPEWIDLGPGTKETMRAQTRAALAVFVEEAAKVAEGQQIAGYSAGYRSHDFGVSEWYLYPQYGKGRSDAAAAIRTLGEE